MPSSRAVPALPGVVREPVRKKDKFHVTGKPTALMQAIVKICEPGGVILDPFAGSGTTLVAAELGGYQWLGSEALEDNIHISNERLNRIPAIGNADVV